MTLDDLTPAIKEKIKEIAAQLLYLNWLWALGRSLYDTGENIK